MTDLPEPAQSHKIAMNVVVHYYTANQMREYRNAALEDAAKVCDRFQARDVGMQPAECAGAIRALKEK